MTSPDEPDGADSSARSGDLRGDPWGAVLDALPGVVFVLSDAGRLVRWNRRLEELSGYTAAELTSPGTLRALFGEDGSRVAARLGAAGEGAREAALVTKDGEKRPLALTAGRAHLGGRPHLVVLGVDGTDTIDIPVASMDSAGLGEHRREEALEETPSSQSSAPQVYKALLGRLGRLAQALGTAGELASVFRALLTFVRDSAPCNGIFVSLYDPQRQERRCVYAWSEGQEEDVSALPPLPMNDSPNSRAVKTGEVVVVDDFQAATAGLPGLDIGLERDPHLPQSSICVPMVVSGRVIGAYEVQSTAPAAYKEEHVLALEVAAGFAAIATENVRLLERERELRRAAQELNETLEDRVRQRTSELEEAYSELETFTYSVSHDLRSPLSGINGFSEALREDYEAQLDETARYYLSRIQGNARRMTQLIDDILALSRVSRKRLRLERVQLGDLAREIVAGLRSEQPERRVVFLCSLGGADRATDRVTDRATDRVTDGVTNRFMDAGVMGDGVMGDGGLLRIVLENLLGNAWKFSANRPEAVIEFGAENIGGERVYYVRDNGPGFEMMYATKIFAVFERLHADTEYSGTGIGLATVERIIHRHGGRIWAEAEPGKGATFFFTLDPQLGA